MAGQSKTRRSTRREAAARQAAHSAAGSARSRFSMDSEQSMRVLLVGGVGLIVAALAAFLVFGYWYSVVRPRHRTVLEADGIKVSYSEMRRRMGYELGQNLSRYGNDASTLGEDTYTSLLNELTVITHAGDLGVTLSDEDFQKALLARVGVPSDASGPTFAAALKKQLDQTGLHEDEYRRMIRAQQLKTQLTSKLQAELPAAVPKAKLEVIETSTEDDANKALARVKAGEDWATVAKEVSIEGDAKTTGGLHDYRPLELIDPTYESFASSANAGDLSQVLPTPNGAAFFIVRLVDRSDQPVTDTEKASLASKKFADWLASTQETMRVKRDWDQQAQADAFVWVRDHVVPKIIAQQQQQAQPTVAVSVPTVAAEQPQGTPAEQSGATPQAPSQPVAPGGNGQ